MLTDKEIDYLEQQFPELFAAAVTQAYWDALASGSSVLVSENGVLKENFPDGSSKIIKEGKPWIKVQKGQVIKIK